MIRPRRRAGERRLEGFGMRQAGAAAMATRTVRGGVMAEVADLGHRA
jgi:hypothetical protein